MDTLNDILRALQARTERQISEIGDGAEGVDADKYLHDLKATLSDISRALQQTGEKKVENDPVTDTQSALSGPSYLR